MLFMADKDRELIEDIERGEYKYGFTSDIDTETIRRGLDEDVISLISEKKGEPSGCSSAALRRIVIG